MQSHLMILDVSIQNHTDLEHRTQKCERFWVRCSKSLNLDHLIRLQMTFEGGMI